MAGVPDWVRDREPGWQDWARANGYSVLQVLLAQVHGWDTALAMSRRSS